MSSIFIKKIILYLGSLFQNEAVNLVVNNIKFVVNGQNLVYLLVVEN